MDTHGPARAGRGWLSTIREVMRDQAPHYPQLENLRQPLLLRGTPEDFKLAVGRGRP